MGLVYVLAAKTNWLPNNPMLWFTMMLMPAGPSAMKVMVLADVADADDKDKMIIAKFLAVSRVLSPRDAKLSVVVGHLRHVASYDVGGYRGSGGV